MRLLFALLLCSLAPALAAQVGVNNPSPEQALDVDGKVKLSDDATPPSDGTVRYNDSEESFEGFAGGEWQSFNKTMTPEDVEEVAIYAFNLPPASGTNTSNFTDETVMVDLETGALRSSTFSPYEVPAGKLLVIDHVFVTGRDEQPDEFFYVGIVRGVGTTGSITIRNPRLYVSGNTSSGTQELTGVRSPLLVLRTGERLAVYNSPNSQTNVRIVCYGFVIDENSLDEFYGY